MSRTIHRLTAQFVKSVTKPGRHADGGNLYLYVSSNGGHRWVFMYMREGRQREAGLGSARDVKLADAREKAREMRQLLLNGVDPIDAKATKGEPSIPTFLQFVDTFMDSIETGFRNEKHRHQWRQTLGEAYCASIHSKKIDTVNVEDVLRILQPHWSTKQETASRLRGRLERVFDAAKAKGLRTGENPARWKGNLKELLPARQKLQRGHQPAMPYAEVPAFVSALRTRQATSALALEFLILTACRAGEVYGATWVEFDIEAKLWTIPAGRMKAGRAHRVPLTARALEILTTVNELRISDSSTAYVFPGARLGKPMSNVAFSKLMERMNVEGVVPHGFRSSFRDWCGECTKFPRELAEGCLAHVIGNAVEQAYRRGDALEKRRKVMDAWAQYVGSKT